MKHITIDHLDIDRKTIKVSVKPNTITVEAVKESIEVAKAFDSAVYIQITGSEKIIEKDSSVDSVLERTMAKHNFYCTAHSRQNECSWFRNNQNAC